MKVKIFLYLVGLLLFPWICLSQQYQTIAKPDSTKWLFASSPLPGKIIDTLFVTDNTNSSYLKILYHGHYYTQKITFAGFLEISDNNDKIWYYSPEDTLKHLIFDLDLQQEDEFNFAWTSISATVDSVYVQNDRKTIQFNFDTDWDEPIKFIEGIGPNITFIKNWKDPGILSPIIVCGYDLDELIFENSNPNFTNCDLDFTSNFSIIDEQICVFPNPFGEYLIMNLIDKTAACQIVCSLYSIVGHKIMEFEVYGDSPTELNTMELIPGMYILRHNGNYNNKPLKLIKQ